MMKAPYGKFYQDGYGIAFDGKLAFSLYEIISPISLLFVTRQPLAVLYVMHYIYRAIIYPFFISHSMKPQSILVILSAFFFNLLNGYNNGHGLKSSTPNYFGVVVFLLGLGINMHSDYHLANLRVSNPSRKQGEYFIPTAGLFRYVSSANYAGECLEWLGWAILVQTQAGWAFWFCTLGNLVPRALDTHKWYKMKFKDYPKDRKAIIPFIL